MKEKTLSLRRRTRNRGADPPMVAWRMKATDSSVRRNLHLPKEATSRKPNGGWGEQTEVLNLRRTSASTTFPGLKLRPGRSMATTRRDQNEGLHDEKERNAREVAEIAHIVLATVSSVTVMLIASPFCLVVSLPQRQWWCKTFQPRTQRPFLVALVQS